jgi:hypothetical protein
MSEIGLRVGISGAGDIARRHANALVDLGAELYIFSPHIMGKRWPDDIGAEKVESYAKLLGLNLDYIVIASPTRFHLEQTIEAIKKGIHIFLEKPIAETFRDMRSIFEAAEKGSSIIIVNYLLTRLHPVSVMMDKKSSEYGLKPIFYDAFRSKYRRYMGYGDEPTGNIFRREMMHDIDVIIAREKCLPEYVWARYVPPASPKDQIDSKGGIAELAFKEAVARLYTSYEDAENRDSKGFKKIKRQKINCLRENKDDVYTAVLDFENNLFKLDGSDICFEHVFTEPRLERRAHEFFASQLERDPKEVLYDEAIPSLSQVLKEEMIVEALMISANENRKVYLKEVQDKLYQRG